MSTQESGASRDDHNRRPCRTSSRRDGAFTALSGEPSRCRTDDRNRVFRQFYGDLSAFRKLSTTRPLRSPRITRNGIASATSIEGQLRRHRGSRPSTSTSRPPGRPRGRSVPFRGTRRPPAHPSFRSGMEHSVSRRVRRRHTPLKWAHKPLTMIICDGRSPPLIDFSKMTHRSGLTGAQAGVKVITYSAATRVSGG